MKQCTKCGVAQPLEAFSKRAKSWDGVQSCCKRCSSAYWKEYNPVHREQISYRQSNPARYRAHNAVESALKTGRLQSQNCELCSISISCAHHHNYSKPLDVSWLCPSCHGFVHRVLRRISKPLQELKGI